MSKLEDFIARSENFQGKVLQQLEDMKNQRAEDRDTQFTRCDNHGDRISILEKAHWKTAGASGLLGVAAGLLASFFGGKH